MLMLNQDKTKYPNFAQFVQHDLGARIISGDAQKVWRAFTRHAQITEGLARKVLTDPTAGPLVRVAELGTVEGRTVLGWFSNEHPDWVFIDESLVKKFEVDAKRREAQQSIEAKVLHEVVHWGDFRDGQHSASEAGTAFEIEAYGREIGRW